jgi:hypothetical protein
VAELGLNGTETDRITGLKKPVGVLAVGDMLFVSDQDLGEVLRAPLENLASFSVLAHVSEPDLLAAGPAGTVLTGGADGVLVKIDVAGKTTNVASGFHRVRGVAYDAANQRAFVADHASKKGASVVRVVPIRDDAASNSMLP